MRNGRSNFVFVRGVVSSTFALVYKENKTLFRGSEGTARGSHTSRGGNEVGITPSVTSNVGCYNIMFRHCGCAL